MFNGELVHMVDKEVEYLDKEDLGEMGSSSLLGQRHLLTVLRAWLRLPRKRFKFIWSPQLVGMPL